MPEIRNPFSISDNRVGYTGKAHHIWKYTQGCNRTTLQYCCAAPMNSIANSSEGSQKCLLLHAPQRTFFAGVLSSRSISASWLNFRLNRLRFSGDGGVVLAVLFGSFSWIFMCLSRRGKKTSSEGKSRWNIRIIKRPISSWLPHWSV